MDPLVGAALVSGGFNLLGGLLGKSGADANAAAQMRMARQNVAYQREFAQHGVRWKAADARAAGIHPLAALGASTVGFKPVAVGDQGSGKRALGRSLTEMGQSLANIALIKAQTRKVNAETKVLSGVAKDSPLDVGGSQEPGSTFIKPAEVTTSKRMGVQSGINPMDQEVVSQYGEAWLAPGKATEEAMESAPWFTKMKMAVTDAVRHGRRAFEMLPRNNKHIQREIVRMRPKDPLKPGYEWRWDVWKQLYVIRKKDRPQGRMFHGVPKQWFDPGQYPGVPYKVRRQSGYNATNYPKARPWKLRKSH